MSRLYRIINTTDDRNLGLIVDLDLNKLPVEFTYRDFFFDNIIWEINEGTLLAHNSNYFILLAPQSR
jgi:hypothetical protein